MNKNTTQLNEQEIHEDLKRYRKWLHDFLGKLKASLPSSTRGMHRSETATSSSLAAPAKHPPPSAAAEQPLLQ